MRLRTRKKIRNPEGNQHSQWKVLMSLVSDEKKKSMKNSKWQETHLRLKYIAKILPNSSAHRSMRITTVKAGGYFPSPSNRRGACCLKHLSSKEAGSSLIRLVASGYWASRSFLWTRLQKKKKRWLENKYFKKDWNELLLSFTDWTQPQTNHWTSLASPSSACLKRGNINHVMMQKKRREKK